MSFSGEICTQTLSDLKGGGETNHLG